MLITVICYPFPDYCCSPWRDMRENRRRPALLYALLAALLAVLCASGCSVVLKKPLDDEARKLASGEFVQLSRGMVHYEFAGPESGAVVVLIHGLATPSFIWDHNVAALADAGFRVLRYDHYGRGFSDRPKATYDQDLFDGQLFELLRKLDVPLPVNLVGLSMGGAVAVTFADRHPGMVSTLSLVAPAGFPVDVPFAITLVRLPIIGEILTAMLGDPVVLADVKESFVDPNALPEFEEKFKVPLQYKGFHRALLSTLRHMDLFGLAETYQRVGAQNKPVLLFWGHKDAVLPFAHSGKVTGAIPHTEFHAFDGAGHNLNYENPELVNPVMIEFLRKNAGAPARL